MNSKLWACLVSAAIILMTLVWGACVLGASPEDRALNFAFIAVGGALGWLLGMLASPYDPSEKKQFSELTKTISLFISGYALAKTGRLIDALVSPDVLLQPLSGFRGLAMLGAIVMAAVVTFVFRQYWRVD
jgi:hypothetical protein